MSAHSTHIRSLLSAEEYTEHQKLTRRLSLLEIAQSDKPMSQSELAELLDVSQKTISLTELRAKEKLRRALARLKAEHLTKPRA